MIKALKNSLSRFGRGNIIKKNINRGSEKRSLNHATRYSLPVLSALFVKASLVARANAERSDRSIHEDNMHNITAKRQLSEIIVF